MQEALAAVGATYSAGNGPLKGSVTFKGISLPISSTAGQLWATEVGSLYQSAQDAAQEHLRRLVKHSAAHLCCRLAVHFVITAWLVSEKACS